MRNYRQVCSAWQYCSNWHCSLFSWIRHYFLGIRTSHMCVICYMWSSMWVFYATIPCYARTLTPVSYTHLDVYKRQVQYHWKLERYRLHNVHKILYHFCICYVRANDSFHKNSSKRRPIDQREVNPWPIHHPEWKIGYWKQSNFVLK